MEDTFEILSLGGNYEGSYHEFIEDSQAVVQAPCRENPRFVSREAENSPTHKIGNPSPNPMEALLGKLDRERRHTAAGVIRNAVAELSPEEQLLVRLVYASDLSASAAGRTLGLRPDQALRRLKKILTGLKARLLEHGIREF